MTQRSRPPRAWIVCLLFVACALSGSASAQNDSDAEPTAVSYPEIVAADKPVAWWRFEGKEVVSETSADLLKPVVAQGDLSLHKPGPPPAKYPLFDAKSQSVEFTGKGVLRIADPGADSLFDFDNGDSITLEAWVNPKKLGNGQQVYVIGKGRTGSPGFPADNQNFGLRLAGEGGTARISFLFRSRQKGQGTSEDWHRWTSDRGFALDSGWHYVAVTYTFGQGDSVRGYVDGKEVKGKWDYGGKTDAAPVVDDDEVWIGSASKMNPGNSFAGGLDEIALYRTALSAERIAARWRVILPKPYVTNVPLPKNKILVEILEAIPDQKSWDFIPPTPTDRYEEERFAWVELPHKYNEHGVRVDRTNPHVIWATTEMDFPAGPQRVLLRCRGGARLYIDDKLVVETPFNGSKGDGHNPVPPVESKVSPNIRPVQPGDSERVVDYTFTEGRHRLKLEFFAGGQRRRPEVGETSVSFAPPESDKFVILGHAPGFPLTDEGWWNWEDSRRQELVKFNQQRRGEASREYAKYWQRRHDYAREFIAAKETDLPSTATIDSLIRVGLEKNKLQAEPPVDDHGFVRRIYLDTIGLTPTADQVRAFLADQRPDRRARLIDALLDNPGWADNWVGYWQDVLAENPNIINPTLNNTGPFREWIYESLVDNKPFDRFATELVMMEGSTLYGGPGGFAMASQNDAPMAAKAHILGEAFLGVEMKCARCHDAPFHPFTQEQLFNLGALLNRGPLTLPKTSTIPGGAGAVKSSIVKVALAPGAKLDARWPFPELSEGDLPSELVLRPGDPRAEAALRLTLPRNERFAQVIVNRLWQRYLGRGIVEPVDDWEQTGPSHPELLEFLARELTTHDYDLKHVARLIFNSAPYQAQPATDAVKERSFAGPTRRRMRAEQVLDSIFGVAGKEFHSEDLNIDVDNGRAESSSLNLGLPKRAWQFISLSNERDRPSLSLPAAQTLMNILEAFGWRASRQDPLTIREQEPTVLQPAILSNGVAAKRIAQLSEDSVFTGLALRDQPVEKLVDELFLQILNRPPSDAERKMVVDVLAPGYEQRRTGAAPGPRPHRPERDGVSWSNHLKPEANQIRVAFQKELEKGDPPTTQLTAEWRERAEDAVWALVNSPEFVFIP